MDDIIQFVNQLVGLLNELPEKTDSYWERLVIWIIIGGFLLFVVSFFFGIDTSNIQTPQQELINQSMANPELNMQIQDVLTAFYNLPLANLIIAFLLFFIGRYLLYSSL